jgi:hypothetical protein
MRSETESLKTGRDYAKAERRSRVLEIGVREVKKFGTLFLYLALVFSLFTLHQWVVLAGNHISYAFYGASVINALILAKIMLVAEALHFGEQFKDRPLAYPILYKSVAFGLMLVVAYVAERFSTSSLMRASNFTVPTTPTLRPKLRKVARRSLSMAMAFDCISLPWVSSIRGF